jgi:hypothetical protein
MMRWAHVAHMEEISKIYNLVGDLQVKRSLEMYRHTKKDLRKTVSEDVDWIHLLKIWTNDTLF